MAKRARGSTTSRPGQRRPLQRSTIRPGASTTRSSATVAPAVPLAPPPATLTDAEEARAAELEAAIVADERRADEAKRRARARPTEDDVRPASNLAISAANEYAYVARDVRRIVLVGGSLIVLLLAMWVVAHIAHLGPF